MKSCYLLQNDNSFFTTVGGQVSNQLINNNKGLQGYLLLSPGTYY